jgi:hypothetical protein
MWERMWSNRQARRGMLDKLGNFAGAAPVVFGGGARWLSFSQMELPTPAAELPSPYGRWCPSKQIHAKNSRGRKNRSRASLTMKTRQPFRRSGIGDKAEAFDLIRSSAGFRARARPSRSASTRD